MKVSAALHRWTVGLTAVAVVMLTTLQSAISDRELSRADVWDIGIAGIGAIIILLVNYQRSQSVQ